MFEYKVKHTDKSDQLYKTPISPSVRNTNIVTNTGNSDISEQTPTCAVPPNNEPVRDELFQTVLDLIARCGNYDKALLDMQCKLDEAMGKINTLKSQTTMNSNLSNASGQLFCSLTNANMDSSIEISNSPDALYSNLETTPSTECPGFVSDTSLTELLM